MLFQTKEVKSKYLLVIVNCNSDVVHARNTTLSLSKYFSSYVDESITLSNFLDEQINYIFALSSSPVEDEV